MESQSRLIAAALINAGTYHHRMGRFDEAIGRYQTALQVKMKAIRPEAEQDIANNLTAVRKELEELRLEYSESSNSRDCIHLDLYGHRSWEEPGMVRVDCKPIRVPVESESAPSRQPTPAEDYRDSAITFYNMGLVHLEKESIEKAGQLFVMASTVITVAIYPDIGASILNGLALVLYLQDKAREALANLTEAVELEQLARAGNSERMAQGQVDVDMNECLANTLSLLGRIHYQNGDFDVALRFCNQLLQLRRSAFGNDDIRVSAIAYNIGLVQLELGKMEEALENCRKFIHYVADWQELDRSLQRRSVASALHVTGIIHVENALVTMGLKLLNLALEARILVIGSDHIEVAKTHLELGKLKRDIGEYMEAKMHYGEALRICRAKLGEDHQDVASIWVSIGQVHYCRGELDEALVIFNQVVQHIRTVIGEGSGSEPHLLNAIGNILLEKGEVERAMEAFVEQTRILTSSGSNSSFDPSMADQFPLVLPFVSVSPSNRLYMYPSAAAA